MKKNKEVRKLSTKIATGFGLVALVLIGTIIFTIINLYRTDLETQKLYHETTPQLLQTIALLQSLEKVLELEKDTLITAPISTNKRFNVIWQESIVPQLNKLIRLVGTENQADMNFISRLNTEFTDLKKNLSALQPQDIPSNLEKRKNYFYEVIYPSFLNLNTLMDTYIKEKESLFYIHIQIIRKQIFVTMLINGGFLILGLILCILLGIVLTKSINFPVRKLVSTMREVAKGDLTQVIQLQDTLEFSLLSESINHVISTFHDIEFITKKMAAGDYSQRVKVKSDKDELAKSLNSMLDSFHAIVEQANAIAKGNFHNEIQPRSSQDKLGSALQNMTTILRKNNTYYVEQTWLKDGVTKFSALINNQRDINTLIQQAFNYICHYVQSMAGIIYLWSPETKKLSLAGEFAMDKTKILQSEYQLNEGIIGQVAAEKKAILLGNSAAEKFSPIQAEGFKVPIHTVGVFPLCYEENLIGVCQYLWHEQPSDLIKQWIEVVSPILGSHINAVQQQDLTESLLNKQRKLAETLSIQQEELKTTNEELEHQTQILKASEEELRVKDEEQRSINKQLAEHAQQLELQKKTIEESNKALETTKKELEIQASELEKASQYKSEFLANMSHELRTPLNSMLILAKLFAKNRENNLTEEQKESAQIMLKSGQDLLLLINDILDLAKVEAGKLSIEFANFDIKSLINNLELVFKPVAQEKKLAFIVNYTDNTPQTLYSDEQRVSQIIRNLLSNAMKFTEEGSITLTIYLPEKNELEKINIKTSMLAISVKDTGIGIDPQKTELIFKAFQQADGTTSRRYGGTGLGLSISKELITALGGQITLQTALGKGSQFTLYFPLNQKKQSNNKESAENSSQQTQKDPTIESSPVNSNMQTAAKPVTQQNIHKMLVIAEKDNFFEKLITLYRKQHFLCRQISNNAEALSLLEKEIPLYIFIARKNCLTENFEAIKTRLNNNTEKTFIYLVDDQKEAPPLQEPFITDTILTSFDEKKLMALLFSEQKEKPTEEPMHLAEKTAPPVEKTEKIETLSTLPNTDTIPKHVLLVDDDNRNLFAIKQALLDLNLVVETSCNGKEALKVLENQKKPFSLILTDIMMPVMDGYALIKAIRKQAAYQKTPIIVLTAKALSQEKEKCLGLGANDCITKPIDIDLLSQQVQYWMDQKIED